MNNDSLEIYICAETEQNKYMLYHAFQGSMQRATHERSFALVSAV